VKIAIFIVTTLSVVMRKRFCLI